MIGKPKNEILVLGGEPRVDLLPPEVRVLRKGKGIRRRLAFGVIVVLLGVTGVTVLARAQADSAKTNLANAQARTQDLLIQQRKYIEVSKLQNEIDTIRAAQQVGTSTEIDWESYLNSVQATLPADVTISTVNIDTATPFAPYTQATAPLQGARVATLTFTARSSTLPQVPAWLNALVTLPGYSDASPGSVTRDTNGGYAVSITMHINQAAFSKRFAAAVK